MISRELLVEVKYHLPMLVDSLASTIGFQFILVGGVLIAWWHVCDGIKKSLEKEGDK